VSKAGGRAGGLDCAQANPLDVPTAVATLPAQQAPGASQGSGTLPQPEAGAQAVTSGSSQSRPLTEIPATTLPAQQPQAFTPAASQGLAQEPAVPRDDSSAKKARTAPPYPWPMTSQAPMPTPPTLEFRAAPGLTMPPPPVLAKPMPKAPLAAAVPAAAPSSTPVQSPPAPVPAAPRPPTLMQPRPAAAAPTPTQSPPAAAPAAPRPPMLMQPRPVPVSPPKTAAAAPGAFLVSCSSESEDNDLLAPAASQGPKAARTGGMLDPTGVAPSMLVIRCGDLYDTICVEPAELDAAIWDILERRRDRCRREGIGEQDVLPPVITDDILSAVKKEWMEHPEQVQWIQEARHLGYYNDAVRRTLASKFRTWSYQKFGGLPWLWWFSIVSGILE